MTYEAKIAAAADRLIRERWCGAYVIAAPADADEGGDPDQPTAVCIGFADEFEDAEQLYERAASLSVRVDALIRQREGM